MDRQRSFVTLFGIGALPGATIIVLLLSLAAAAGVLYTLGMETLFMLTLLFAIVGIFESNKYLSSESAQKEHIVIDDVVGIWLAVMTTLPTAATLPFPYATWGGMVLAALAYTLFSTWKPSTIGWMYHNLKGGLGVMLSSVIAGIAGGLLSVVVLMGVGKLF